jgi:alkylhydroperoxidase/carboxymuconolactone decarboxylase family protein YurZ
MTYATQLAGLTHAALNQGVSPAEIIQALEIVKLEIGFQMFLAAQAQAEESPSIIKPGQ